jgi:hypothetical protein
MPARPMMPPAAGSGPSSPSGSTSSTT